MEIIGCASEIVAGSKISLSGPVTLYLSVLRATKSTPGMSSNNFRGTTLWMRYVSGWIVNFNRKPPMRTHSIVLRLLILSTLALTACSADKTPEVSGPPSAGTGISPDGTLHPSAIDRCPICAMTTLDKQMASAIELDDGRTFYFCGTGCMLKASLHPDVFLAAGDHSIARIMTTDYLTGKPLDAQKAIWIAGSDVVGAMGPMIVPIASQLSMPSFNFRHGGEIIFRWEEFDDALWESIMKKKADSR
jgi:nitrous oxide reductase accessory protein NosL